MKFKKHLQNEHSKTVGDDNQWGDYCKIIKSVELTAIKSQESSPLVEKNVKNIEKRELIQIEPSNKGASIEESDASSEYKTNEKATKKSSGKERKKKAGATKKRSIDKATSKKGSSKRTPRKPATHKSKEKPIVNKTILYNEFSNEDVMKDNEEAGNIRLKREMVLNESNEISSKLPQKRAQTFFIEKPQEKKLHVDVKKSELPISQDFATKLSKAQIDTKKVISFTSLQSKSENKKAAIQPKLSEVTGQQLFVPLEEKSIDRIKGLSTKPSVPLECKDHNHIHGDGCGHVLVTHESHIDAIHNGELHYTNSTGRVFPHKLAISKTNPDVCNPICGSRSTSNEILEELITPHVTLVNNNRMTTPKMKSIDT